MRNNPRARYYLCALFGLLMAIAPLLYAADPICPTCQKPVASGQFIKVGSKEYHAACVRCAQCSKSIGANPFFEMNGRYYDESCYRKLHTVYCGHCKKEINGTYREAAGVRYHENCYLNFVAPHCAFCLKPIVGEMYQMDTLEYHEGCFVEKVASQCAICKKAILDEYLQDFWGNMVHARHAKDLPGCEYCQRLICKEITGDGLTYADGRKVCNLCLASAVQDSASAGSVAREAERFLSEVGIEVSEVKFTVKLVDRWELAKIAQGSEVGHLGYTVCRRQSFLGGLIAVNDRTVYLLTGMPRTIALATMAHELTHVWMCARNRGHGSPALIEGSCNYAASLLMKSLATKEAECWLAVAEGNPDPRYGVGYRKVREYVGKVGVAKWLKYLASHDEAPW